MTYRETGRSVMEMGCPPVIRQAIRRQLAAVYAQEAEVYGVVVDPELVMADATLGDGLSPDHLSEMAASATNGAAAPAATAAPATPAPAMAAAPAPMTDDGKDPKRIAAGKQAWKTREANANRGQTTAIAAKAPRATASRATTRRKANGADKNRRGVKAFDTKVRKYIEAHPGASEAEARRALMQHTADARTRKAQERNNPPPAPPKSSQTRTPSRTTGRRLPANPAQQQEAARA